MQEGRTAQELTVGERASLSRAVSEGDLALFAGATGDVNPIHFDQSYAEGTFFRGRIAHGILSAGLVSAVIGNQLPGLSTIYVSQTLRFLAPVRPGDTVTAQVEVLEIDVERNRVRLRTTCVTQSGTVVLDGEAVVMPPRRKPSGELAQAIVARGELTGRRLRAATAAFAAVFSGSTETALPQRQPPEGSSAAPAGHGELSQECELWVRQRAQGQEQGLEAVRQWVDLLGTAGRDYLRAWEGGGSGGFA